MDLWAFFQWNKLLFKNIVCPEKNFKNNFEKKCNWNIIYYYLFRETWLVQKMYTNQVPFIWPDSIKCNAVCEDISWKINMYSN